MVSLAGGLLSLPCGIECSNRLLIRVMLSLILSIGSLACSIERGNRLSTHSSNFSHGLLAPIIHRGNGFATGRRGIVIGFATCGNRELSCPLGLE